MEKPEVYTPKIDEFDEKQLLPKDIDIEQLMLHSRQLHLTGVVCSKTIQPLIKQIMGLALVGDGPIVLWINSPGGYINDGFALIDCMRFSKVPIITVIRGQACSMAGLISVAGHNRVITENSYFMAHDAQGGAVDYVEKAKVRMEFVVREQKQVFDFLKKNTKLTIKDLEYAKNKELWLGPQECLDKGVVDQVIKFQVTKRRK